MNTPGLSTVLTGLLLVHLVLAALLFRWRWLSREKPPVSEKLLRAPGERLRRRLDRLDEFTDWTLVGTPFVAIGTLLLGFWLLPRLTSGEHQVFTVVATLSLFTLVVGAAAWFLLRVLAQRRDLRRALQGERVVAESLATLVPTGAHVFHDVPTESGNPADNLHHVVLSPVGVFAIYTQTHARRKAIAGRKEHEILFDEDHLIYPWGQDAKGLVPARQKALWLSDWIFQIVGERIAVSPVLTFPGWWVTPITQRDVRVQNPGQIAAYISQSAPGKITAKQIELIAKQLEARCRDVEF